MNFKYSVSRIRYGDLLPTWNWIEKERKYLYASKTTGLAGQMH